MIPTCPACKSTINVVDRKLDTQLFKYWACFPCPAQMGRSTFFITKREKKMTYMVIAKPGTVDYHNPSKTYETKAQAIEVAKSLATDKQKTYCVVKVIAEARISKVEVEEYE